MRGWPLSHCRYLLNHSSFRNLPNWVILSHPNYMLTLPFFPLACSQPDFLQGALRSRCRHPLLRGCGSRDFSLLLGFCSPPTRLAQTHTTFSGSRTEESSMVGLGPGPLLRLWVSGGCSPEPLSLPHLSEQHGASSTRVLAQLAPWTHGQSRRNRGHLSMTSP